MIPRIKGLKISNAIERIECTGNEMIPFQEGDTNGKIRMSTFREVAIFVFDPTIREGKVMAQDYLDLQEAILDHKIIYAWNSEGTGLIMSTENAIVDGELQLELPNYVQEPGSNANARIDFESIIVRKNLIFTRTRHSTPVLKTTGDGTAVLTDDGTYWDIEKLALTNIKIKDGTNTSVYDLVTDGILFTDNDTECIQFTTSKAGDNISVKLHLAKATQTMDGIMSKEDKLKLDVTIPNQIQDLRDDLTQEIQDRKDGDTTLQNNIDAEAAARQAADAALNARVDKEIEDRKEAIDFVDGKIDKEIQDRKDEINRVETKFDDVTDDLEAALNQEIADRKAGDTTITNTLNNFMDTKAQPGGLASLDSTGKVPAAQLPSYVDDVLEYSNMSLFPATGETGKIYVAKDTNLTYRWTGTQYIEISKSLALGETSSTAYQGNKGKANRDSLVSLPNSLIATIPATTQTGELVKVNYKYVTKNGLNYTAPQDANVDIPSATTTKAGVLSAVDKVRLDELYDEFGGQNNPGQKLNTLSNTLVTEIDNITRTGTSATFHYKDQTLNANNSYSPAVAKTQEMPMVSATLAGLMFASDKYKIDGITHFNQGMESFVANAEDVRIRFYYDKDTVGNQRRDEKIINPAEKTKAGVMRATDYVLLTETLPNQITEEIQNRRDGDTNLQNQINQEILDRKEGDLEITNNFQEFQQDINTQISNLVSGTESKVGAVIVTGSGNAVTDAHIGTGTLTLTKGATYNYYVHPAGNAPSKASAFYKFSTDATSHINSVTAVVQKDITDLGILNATTVNNLISSLRTELKNYIDTAISNLNGSVNTQITQINADISDLQTDLSSHVNNKSNPHSVTKAQVGLGNVDNTSDVNKPVSTAQRNAINAVQTAIDNHAARRDNPHVVTRAQLSLATTDSVVFKQVSAPSGFFKQ